MELQFIKKNIKLPVTIGIETLSILFSCGCFLFLLPFHNYTNMDQNERTIKFTVFMVFIAVSMSVTAFPVLCRILNELRIIKDRAGIVVLGAGIINDIFSWILLALSIIYQILNQVQLIQFIFCYIHLVCF